MGKCVIYFGIISVLHIKSRGAGIIPSLSSKIHGKDNINLLYYPIYPVQKQQKSVFTSRRHATSAPAIFINRNF